MTTHAWKTKLAWVSLRFYERLSRPVRGSNRGLALLWALVVFAVLSVSVVNFLDTTRTNYALAVNQSDEVKAYFNARSGVHLQMLGLMFQNELAQDPVFGQLVENTNFQVWEVMSYILPLFTSGELRTGIGAVQIQEQEEDDWEGPYTEWGDIEFQRPTPEEGKINLNAFASRDLDLELVRRFCHMIAPPQWQSSMSISESSSLRERFEVIGAIIDHIDPDSDMSEITENCEYNIAGRGNESSRYRDFDWEAKNQPLTTHDEIRLIPGVTESFIEQFGDQLTVYPLASNDLFINQADATMLLGFLCSHFRGSNENSQFTPCNNAQIGYEVARIALALDGYIKFFQNPLNVIMFYLGGMGGMGTDEGRLTDGIARGQMQAFRRPQQLESVLTAIMSNPQFELYFMAYADRGSADRFELQQARGAAQVGLLPAFTIRPQDFDVQRMASNISTDTPGVFTIESVGTARRSESRIRAVVDTSSQKPEILYWREY